MRRLAGALIRPEDWPAFATLCAGDTHLPQSFAAWEALVRDVEDAALRMGQPITPVHIDVGHFGAWCSKVGFVPDLTALGVFVVLTRRAFEAQASGEPRLKG